MAAVVCMMRAGCKFLVVLFLSTMATLGLDGIGAEVDYEKQIAPIFADRCIDCHGPDKNKAAFRVDQRAIMLRGGDSGLPAIVPGDPKGSFLMEAITGADPDMQMPPKGDPLSDAQIKLIETWIEQGSHWPGQMDAVAKLKTDHWSYQPVSRPKVPADDSSPVDAFLNRKLTAAGLAANQSADAGSLIRRVSIILTGLPPKPERLRQFEAEFAKDADQAYTELVDELLASPHFGERWAQHWLDVIRWAETNGSEANLYRKNAWIYRDYVIRAFNEDVPYDQFVREQLAGDRLGVGEATGFLVAGPHVPAATVGAEPTAIRQARADRMDEILQTVGASILGVTVSCARCHNHKFDPVSIQDYYSMTAVFQGVEFGGRWPEFSDQHPRKQRANEIYPKMSAARRVLRENGGYWEEDWGGFRDFRFPAVTTKALRVEFLGNSVGIDELEVFGPTNDRTNHALAANGAKLVSDPKMIKLRGELFKANDGDYGTMAWRAQAKDGIKPWVEIHFPEPKEVQRFRSSSNREYFFETDYLSQSNGKYWSKGYRILALQDDGKWKEVGDTAKAKQRQNKNPKLKQAWNRLQAQIGKLTEEGPRHSFVGRFIRPKTTFVLHRGSPENPRDEVAPAGFEMMAGDLGLDSKTPGHRRRMEYAKWLTDPTHPLTARVMVNRLWHHIFGAGIVPTTSDFGKAGALPSHPELLDWLAAEFVENDKWSMKTMIRRLVTTDAFRRSSLPDETSLAADAGAALLWRYPPQRVEAEVIRDGILQASGKLNPEIGGRGFRIHNVKKTYAQWQVVNNHGPETWRRMIYQERMRRVDDRIFTAFDFPDCGQIRAKRPVSTTPLQALNLMNSDFVVEQCGFIAERAKAETEDAEGAVRRVFELILLRQPDAGELDACRGLGLEIVARSLVNANEFAFLP